MTHVIQTEALVREGVLSAEQGGIIAARSRQVMTSLAINAVLSFGILAAALGFIFLLQNALAVAVTGAVFLGVGVVILTKGGDLARMFGIASALIGAGMLCGGATFEIMASMTDTTSGLALAGLGAFGLVGTGLVHRRGFANLGFLTASLVLMTGAMHLIGVYLIGAGMAWSGLPVMLMHLYVAAITFALGWFIDLRLISALAIVPFAQILDTGTFYWSAIYVFYSPETTLSILQLSVAMAVCVYLASRLPERTRRHTAIFGIMAFIVANLCFLVGSLWGDVVGETYWGPTYGGYDGDWQAYDAARDAYRASAWVISDHVYSIVWAALLIFAAFWAAQTNRRGVFNAAMTFGAIHAYTQVFETFYSEPLAYVIGGLVAIPLAWGLWRLNDRFEARASASAAA